MSKNIRQNRKDLFRTKLTKKELEDAKGGVMQGNLLGLERGFESDLGSIGGATLAQVPGPLDAFQIPMKHSGGRRNS